MPQREDDLFTCLLKEAEQPFSGWDFSYITRTGRWSTEPFPWGYASILLPFIRRAASLLDMGTGGGEFLSLLQPLPPHTCATESYAPNIPIARQRLEPLGVKVAKFTNDAELPFKDEEFEVIINRHESYNPVEVKRILKPKGFFITQQVGEQNDIEINELLGEKIDKEEHPWNAKAAAFELEATGFKIRKTIEAFPLTRFYDIGAIVYYLKAIPWVVPNFSIKKYRKVLHNVHKQIQREGYVDIHQHRFLIISQK